MCFDDAKSEFIFLQDLKIDGTKLNTVDGIALTHSAVPNGVITSDTTISQVLAMLKSVGVSLSTPCINLNLVNLRKRFFIILPLF